MTMSTPIAVAHRPRRSLGRVVIGSMLLLGACAPVTAYNGFQARDDKPADMKVGVDTKSTVLTRLGSPSTVSAFDPNSWYYISQVTDRYAFYKPKVRTRDVVVITFGKDEHVAAVKKLDLDSGLQIAFDKRETATRGRQLSWIEQVIGTIGRGGLLPQDNDPGNPNGRQR